MGNLADVIINQVIGALIGTVVSFVTSWYFYKKADFGARVSGEMTENILAMIVQNKLGEDFDINESPPDEQLPKDPDTPHVIEYWFVTKTPVQGESVLALFRIEDTGLDFSGSEYVEVTDTSTEISFPVNRQGHGYYSCKIHFPVNAMPGQHKIEFKLTDRKNKTHKQFVKFDVKPPSSE